MSQLKATDFDHANVLLGKGQNEYNAIPAYLDETTSQQRLVVCWELTPEQLGDIARSGVLWHSVLTFGAPFQPMLIQTDSPFVEQPNPQHNEFYTDPEEINKSIALYLKEAVMHRWLPRDIHLASKKLLKEKGII